MRLQIRQLLLFIFFINLMPCAFSQSWQWAGRVGGASPDPNSFSPDESFKDMAVDSQGNIYVCGNIRMNANANGIPLTTYGNYDIVVAKYDCQGSLVWIKTSGGPGEDRANSLLLDGLGNIYVTGMINGGLPWHTTLFGDTLTDFAFDMYLSKLDTAGNLIWNKIAAPGASSIFSMGITLNFTPAGNISVATAVSDSLGALFPGDTLYRGFWIVTFDTSGTDLLTSFIVSDNVLFNDFKISNTNDFYFIGEFQFDSVLIGGLWIHHFSSLPQSLDLVFAKTDSAGSLQWLDHKADTLHGGIGLFGEKISIANNGDLLISGAVPNGIVFGSDTILSSIGDSGKFRGFVARYNPQGQVLWAANIHTHYESEASGGVYEKPNGEISFSGYAQGNSQFGSSSFSNPVTKIFIANLSATGIPLNAHVLEDNVSPPTSTYPECMGIDANNNVYVGGGLGGSITVNGTTYASAGGETDAFVLKYGVANCIVGIDELDINNVDISIYPNPANSQFTIYSLPTGQAGSKFSVKQVEIFNLIGEKIFDQTFESGQSTTIPISSLAAGMYFVKVFTEKGVVTKKLIKE